MVPMTHYMFLITPLYPWQLMVPMTLYAPHYTPVPMTAHGTHDIIRSSLHPCTHDSSWYPWHYMVLITPLYPWQLMAPMTPYGPHYTTFAENNGKCQNFEKFPKFLRKLTFGQKRTNFGAREIFFGIFGKNAFFYDVCQNFSPFEAFLRKIRGNVKISQLIS